MTPIERSLKSASYWYAMWLELKEWHEDSQTSHSEAFDLGFKAAKNLNIQEQDQNSYASGYEAGRKDGDAICVNRIRAMEYPKTRFE